MKKRHEDYLALAEFWAKRKSKDPSTKVGAVVVSEDGTREFLGYNGFPRGVIDAGYRYRDRGTKYNMVVHAEVNALLKAGREAKDGTIYTWPFPTCNECAKLIIQSGIKQVICATSKEVETRWAEQIKWSKEMYKEAGVKLVLIDVGENDEKPDDQSLEGAGCSSC